MSKTHNLLIIFLITNLMMFSQNQIEVHALKLSGNMPDGKLSIENIVSLGDAKSEKRTNKIKLYPNIEFQTLEGFGGAFNEIGGEALMCLPTALQDQVITNLFSVDQGAALSFNRTAVGASDFGIDAYSYSEKAGDYEMKHFSIKREATTVIPYIQKAFKENPDLKLFASPWSPPAWMKYSGLMDRGENFLKKTN